MYNTKNTKTKKNLIAEMNHALNKINRINRNTKLNEGMIFDDEDDFDDIDRNEDSDQDTSENMTPNELNNRHDNSSLINNIRIEALEGMKNLANDPTSVEYDLLKKIFLLIDKSIENNRDESQQNNKNKSNQQ